jgi:hypothetical protein
VHLDRLKRAEREKQYAEREKLYREISEKILDIVKRRLDRFDPEELGASGVIEWLKNGIDVERELYGKTKPEASSLCKQLEINFTNEFEGI